MINGYSRQDDHEEEISMLVGMGFDAKIAKRAMEANSWNMQQAINDLTSGDLDAAAPSVPEETTNDNSSRRPQTMNDSGLNSLSVPRRTDLAQGDETRRARKKKSKKRHKRHEHASDNARQPRSPATTTQRISEFDVTHETPPTSSSSTMRSMAQGSWQFDSPRDAQPDSVVLNQSRASVNEEANADENPLDFSDAISWPNNANNSGMVPARTAAAVDGPSDTHVLENSDPHLRYSPSASAHHPGQVSNAQISMEASFEAVSRAGNESFANQDQTPQSYVTGITADEEAVAPVQPYSNYVSRSVPRGGVSPRGGFDFSWCKPSMSFGFLVLIGVVLVVPAVVVTVAFLVPRQVSPDPVYTPLKEELTELLRSVSLDNGTALLTPSTPQNDAFNWLMENAETNSALNKFLPYGDMQTTQRYALATLYFSTAGPDNWGTNDGWLSQQNECLEWFHHYTKEFCTSGALVDLDLSNNRLQGTLPDELSILGGSLKSLSLDNNALSGTIPSSIGLLSNLASLGLSGDDLTGAVPTELNQLTKLEYLYLYGNALTGDFSCNNRSVTPYCYASCNTNEDSCRSIESNQRQQAKHHVG